MKPTRSTTRIAARPIVTVLLACALVACGGSDSAGPGDGGQAAGVDAQSDAASETGAGAPGVGAGCTDLATTRLVTSQPGTGDYPTPAGGAIADGTYVLTKNEIWPPDPTPTVMRGGALRFTGSTVEAFDYYPTLDAKVVGKGTYTLAGNVISFSYTCPGPGGYSKPYTATANQFLWFAIEGGSNGSDVRKQVWTFTKQ